MNTLDREAGKIAKGQLWKRVWPQLAKDRPPIRKLQVNSSMNCPPITGQESKLGGLR